MLDVYPKFNNGVPAVEFPKYIAQKLKYPNICAENGISGTVEVAFAVNQKGKVTDIVITKSVDPALNREARRVIKSSPKWTPGEIDGNKVKVIYTFPIHFVLE